MFCVFIYSFQSAKLLFFLDICKGWSKKMHFSVNIYSENLDYSDFFRNFAADFEREGPKYQNLTPI